MISSYIMQVDHFNVLKQVLFSNFENRPERNIKNWKSPESVAHIGY